MPFGRLAAVIPTWMRGGLLYLSLSLSFCLCLSHGDQLQQVDQLREGPESEGPDKSLSLSFLFCLSLSLSLFFPSLSVVL